MIYGIGIDIVKIKRMRDADKKWGRSFFEKFLSENEIAYCFEKKEPYSSVSVRFAAKEALIKAIGSEININMKDIEVVLNKKGRPSIAAHGSLGKFLKERQIRHCHLSLSHEKEFGVACVVLES
jgi:holo-[acyl-carrier protein] synthase